MNIAIDAVAGWTGGGASRVRELATTMPALRPQNRYLLAVGRKNSGTAALASSRMDVVSPPRMVVHGPTRVAWEYAWFPLVAKGFRARAVLGPFNLIPEVWPGRRPFLGVIVSNLAPFSAEVRRSFSGMTRARLETLNYLTRRAVRAADRVFLLSKQAFDLIPEPSLVSKAELIAMAPPTVDVLEAYDGPAESDRPYVLVVGDLYRYKGVEQLIRAQALIPRSERPLALICGRPSDGTYVRALRGEVRERGLAGDVRFLGPADHAHVLRLMAGSVATVIPSRFENGGRVPLEAMATGSPVIAVSAPWARETCGAAAAYFEPDQVDRLADAIRQVMRDGSARDHLVAAGRSHLASMLTTDASERILLAMERAG